jgi:tetratricopeptide (TPR) repeat protein
VACLGVLTYRQALVYGNEETIWRDVLGKHPDCWLGFNNLGVLSQNAGGAARVADEARGSYEQARNFYERALTLNPDYARAHYNLGAVLDLLGHTAEAIAHYQQALRIRPHYANAHNNYGVILGRTGQDGPALEQFELALKANPSYFDAHYNLGHLLDARGQFKEARLHLEEAVRLRPDYAPAHFRLAQTLERLGNVPEAVAHYEKMAALWPRDGRGAMSAAWLLATHDAAEGGDPAQAVMLAQRACAVAGDVAPELQDTLGAAYAAAGRFPEAIRAAQHALDLARQSGAAPLAREIEARLALCRAGQPYRIPANPSR